MKKFLLVVFFTMIPVLAHGGTYYVAKTGSDNNSCSSAKSQSTPKLTITAGAGCLSAGDTLIVQAGTYAERLDNVLPAGTAGSPTTLRANTGDVVTLMPPAPGFWTAAITLLNSYVTVDGLVIDLSNGGGLIGGVLVNGPTISNVTIQNNEIKNMVPPADPGNGGTGIALRPTTAANPSIVVRNNHIHHLASAVTDGSNNTHGIYMTSTATAENNHIHDVASHGIHMYNASPDSTAHDNIIRNNVVHDTGSRGMLIGSGANNVAYNNIVYHNGLGDNREAINVGGYGNLATNNQIYNNTIYVNNGVCIRLGSPVSTFVRNNICYHNGTDAVVRDNDTNSTIDHNLLGTDPLFVNAAAGNFRLSIGSPAIGAGVVMPGLSYNGSAPDLGALQSGTGGAIPAPVNLRLVGN
jgi:parallel beta-helix repeat protein